MKLAALVSGGKDSWYAAYLAKQRNHELVCIVTLRPESSESYMFHFPNVEFVEQQAEAAGLPLISLPTKGMKEHELKELKEALNLAKQKYHIEGVVSGAIASEYQKKRIENVCAELELKSITPIWGIRPEQYMMGLFALNFDAIIIGIAADGLNELWLGRKLDRNAAADMKKLNVSTIGEGGEYESFVLDCPLFKKRLEIWDSTTTMENKCTGRVVIKEIQLLKK